MDFSETELVTILADADKTIVGDISWTEDEDHSPALEFRQEIVSQAGYPLFVRGASTRWPSVDICRHPRKQSPCLCSGSRKRPP